MNDAVLILGGGVAGLHAAVELVQLRFRVVLVEKRGAIGGRLAGSGVISPSGEHAACARRPLIEILANASRVSIHTDSILAQLRGDAGAFTATIRRSPHEPTKKKTEHECHVGAVIVATGPQGVAGEVAGVRLDDTGCVLRAPGEAHPLLTSRSAVFVSGRVTGALNITESVIQGCAAAAHAAAFLTAARRSDDTPTVKTPARAKKDDEPHILVLLVSPGDAWPDGFNARAVADHARERPGVDLVVQTTEPLLDTRIEELVSGGDFNRLVVAGPSPISHEPQVHRAVEAAGLNRYRVEMVNLHDQCVAVHSQDPAAATEKATMLMAMGVARALRLEPLEPLRCPVRPAGLVIGGGPGGIACASTLAAMGLDVHLVDGASDFEEIPENQHRLVRSALAAIWKHERISMHAGCRADAATGHVGDFRVRLTGESEPDEVEVGAIVVTSQSGIASSGNGAAFNATLGLETDAHGDTISTEGTLNLLNFVTAGVFNGVSTPTDADAVAAVIRGEAAAAKAATIIASPILSRSPIISSVVDKNCDGCAYCVEPCPTQSITLLEYRHEGGVKKVIAVNEATCIGCGICMSTCPKEGAFVRHYPSATFAAMIETALEARGSMKPDAPLVIAICCNRCAYPGADAAGADGISYPPGIRIIRTVCAGMIHPSIITDALTQGVDGILLAGCHSGECRSREGIRKAQARAEVIELLLEDLGLEPERFRLESIAASDGERFARIASDFTQELIALGPNPFG